MEKIECKNSPKYHIKKMRLALQGDDCWAGRDKLIKNNRQNTGVRDDTYKQFITLTTTKTRDQLIIEFNVSRVKRMSRLMRARHLLGRVSMSSAMRITVGVMA